MIVVTTVPPHPNSQHHNRCLMPEDTRYGRAQLHTMVETAPHLSLQLSVTVRTTYVITIMCGWGSSSVILVYKLRKSYPEVIYYLGILCFNHRKGGGMYGKASDLPNEGNGIECRVRWSGCKRIDKTIMVSISGQREF
jgi:hypothetical protein